MAYGNQLIKLSEIPNQDHVTSVLRAMVIRREFKTKNICIVGDDKDKVVQAFNQSLNCLEPVKGDACGNCQHCTNMWWFGQRPICIEFVNEAESNPKPGFFYITHDDSLPGFFKLYLKDNVVKQVDSKLLHLVLCAVDNNSATLLRAVKAISKQFTFEAFSNGLLDIFISLIHTTYNMGEQQEHEEVLRKLSQLLSAFKIHQSMRVIWDAQNKPGVDRVVAMHMIALRILEVMHPIAEDETVIDPIIIVEHHNEQPLSFKRLFEIAHE